jgi:hypothetical protein
MMKVKTIFVMILIHAASLNAHQPVMDMAPRWNGGYGIQFRYERFDSKKIKTSNSVDQFLQETLWAEGVYTWNRAKRITFKLPFHRMISDSKIDHYTGDLILALPLKKYSNFKQRTQNFGLTPQIQLPLGNIKTGGQLGGGLSLSYSSESFAFYQLHDLYFWIYDEKKPMLGFDLNLGIHPIHNNSSNSGLFAMWDVTAKWTEASTTILSGPVLVPYYQNIMARLEIKFPVIENGKKGHILRGPTFNVGLGFVF